jgi:hypothetical protein
MPTFTVQSATQVQTKQTEYGPMQSIDLMLQEPGQGDAFKANWYTKATTPVPAPGQTLEGEVTDSQYGKKFKKAPPAAGGFRGGGRSPQETRQIVRQHSQHMALLYVQAKAAVDALPADFKPSDLKAIIDWFDADALEPRA